MIYPRIRKIQNESSLDCIFAYLEDGAIRKDKDGETGKLFLCL